MIDLDLLKKIRDLQKDKGKLLDIVSRQDELLRECYKELVICYKTIINLADDI